MEIVVSERLTGAAWRDRILERWGDRATLEEAAQDHVEASSALADLQLLDEDPTRLDREMVVEDHIRLDPDDVAKLTGERFRLIAELEGLDQPVNVTRLAERLGRDKKNVSLDVRELERLGLVWTRRQGREKLVGVRRGELRVRVG